MGKYGPIGKELRQRQVILADPQTEWVNHSPRGLGQSCLVIDDRMMGYDLSTRAFSFLERFLVDYDDCAVAVLWNDQPDRTREQVVHMLDEAIAEAKRLGV